MEELIGIIAAIAVVIFKAVSKKMNDSADKPLKPAVRPMQPEPMRQWESLEEVFPGLSNDYETDDPEPKVIHVDVPDEAPKENAEQQVRRKPSPVETAAESLKDSEKKEKIDPKKLIIYSEIMNRKY